MKALKIAVVLFSMTTHASAGEVSYTSDGSKLSEVCISALHSLDEAKLLAQKLRLSRHDWHSLQCNGVALKKFVKAHSADKTAPRTFALKPGDKSPATELCIAALESPWKLDAMKEGHFGKHFNVSDSLQCNGEPLDAFVRRFSKNSIAKTE